MKDSPKANFPIHFTISCDNKIDKLAKNIVLNICLRFLATKQFYEIRKGVPTQIHASRYMLKSYYCQEGKQVRHTDGFQ